MTTSTKPQSAAVEQPDTAAMLAALMHGLKIPLGALSAGVNGLLLIGEAISDQAKADAEQLDWIIAQGDEFRCFIITDAAGDGDYMVVGAGRAVGQGKTAREAIDAARKSTAPQGDA